MKQRRPARRCAALTACAVALGACAAAGERSLATPTDDAYAFVPVKVSPDANKPLEEWKVRMCKVDWKVRREDPSALPMFRDLLTHSLCFATQSDTVTYETTFGELEAEYKTRGCDQNSGGPGCAPAGMVFHQSRCGSTLFSNMMAALPWTLTYSEPGPPADVILSSGLSHADTVRALRVIVAGMGRPILSQSPLAEGWAPSHLYYKWQSSLVPHAGVMREAFPATPWAFVYRDGVEVLTSLLRNAGKLPEPGPAPRLGTSPASLQHVDANDAAMRGAPCLRAYPRNAPAYVARVLGLDQSGSSGSPAPEDFCAASVSQLLATAVQQGAAARREGLEALGLYVPFKPAVWEDAKAGGAAYADGANFLAMVANATAAAEQAAGEAAAGGGSPVKGLSAPALPDAAGAAAASAALAAALRGVTTDARTGAVMDAVARNGVLGGVGQGYFVPYEAMPTIVIELMAAHMAPRGGYPGGADAAASYKGAAEEVAPFSDLPIPAPHVAAMLAIAPKYSKARGRTAGQDKSPLLPGRRGPLRGPSLDETGRFVEDSEDKQARAWPALRLAAARFLAPLEPALAAFNPPLAGKAKAAPAPASQAGAAAEVTALPERVSPLQAWPPELVAAGVGQALVPNGAAGANATGALPPVPARSAQLLPIGGGYPQLYPMSQILTEWNADIVTVPKSYGKYQSLRVFDFMTELEEAEVYRRAEVPFLITNVPFMNDTIQAWGDDATLVERSGGGTKQFPADVNDNNHFMYYNKGRARRDKNYKAPTSEATLTMPDWLEAAYAVSNATYAEEAAHLPAGWALPAALATPPAGLNPVSTLGVTKSRADPAGAAEAPHIRAPGAASLKAWAAAGGDGVYGAGGGGGTSVLPPARSKRTMYYLRASSDPRRTYSEHEWINADFPMFKPERSFFQVDPVQQRGIHCRFGMPGIIAESHYDAGRNYVFMTRGRKRYILSPPAQCPNLAMLTSGPSARHSYLDWSAPEDVAKMPAAQALEVVMEPGTALYIPAFWFHFIVSLTVNIQCNSRSGTPPHGGVDIVDCGLEAHASEEAGLHTDVVPPLSHLLATATGEFDFATAPYVPAARALALADAIQTGVAQGRDEARRATFGELTAPWASLLEGSGAAAPVAPPSPSPPAAPASPSAAPAAPVLTGPPRGAMPVVVPGVTGKGQRIERPDHHHGPPAPAAAAAAPAAPAPDAAAPAAAAPDAAAAPAKKAGGAASPDAKKKDNKGGKSGLKGGKGGKSALKGGEGGKKKPAVRPPPSVLENPQVPGEKAAAAAAAKGAAGVPAAVPVVATASSATTTPPRFSGAGSLVAILSLAALLALLGIYMVRTSRRRRLTFNSSGAGVYVSFTRAAPAYRNSEPSPPSPTTPDVFVPTLQIGGASGASGAQAALPEAAAGTSGVFQRGSMATRILAQSSSTMPEWDE